MSDEMKLDFEEFSRLLDEEENLDLPSDYAEETSILLELRETLRADDGPSLPKEFAEKTAALTRVRYTSLHPTLKFLRWSESHLLRSAFDGISIGRSFFAVSVGIAMSMLGFDWLLGYGILLGTLCGGWIFGKKMCREELDNIRPNRTLEWLSRPIYYAFPLLATLFSGLLAKAFITGLCGMSLSFKDSRQSGDIFGWVVGSGVFILLVKALLPLWKAMRERTKKNFVGLLLVQAFHSVWFALGLFLCVNLYFQADEFSYTPEYLQGLEEHWKSLLALTVFLSIPFSLFLRRYSYSKSEVVDLKLARRTFIERLVLGFIPLLLALVVFYQLHLTRSIHESYNHALADARSWEQQQMAVPEEENGWLLLRPFFLRSELDRDPENGQLGGDVHEFSQYYLEPEVLVQKDQWPEDELHPTDPRAQAEEKEAYEKAKKTFLSYLPLLKKALAKPFFSYIATEGFHYESHVPNYVAYRAISQNLSQITRDSLEEDDVESALEHILFALKWASKEEPGALLSLLIRMTMLKITVHDIEKPVLSGDFDELQLQELITGLKAAQYDPELLSENFKRESLLAEKLFRRIIKGEFSSEGFGSLGFAPLATILPKSYWESERKAYWNYQLGQMDRSRQLSFQEGAFDLEEEISPFNLASHTLVPNSHRAQAQFCYLHSRLSSLILMCHAERYKLQHQTYPDSLEALVPEFIPELPVDLMSPERLGRKKGFRYLPKDEVYTLLSESKEYKTILLNRVQSYGHDGDFTPNNDNAYE